MPADKKRKLREAVLARRDQIPESVRKEKSASICTSLLSAIQLHFLYSEPYLPNTKTHPSSVKSHIPDTKTHPSNVKSHISQTEPQIPQTEPQIPESDFSVCETVPTPPQIPESDFSVCETVPTPPQIPESDSVIPESVKGKNTLAGKTIAAYGAMKSEVSLGRFIQAAYAQGARLCFPCIMKENRTSVSRETFPHYHENSEILNQQSGRNSSGEASTIQENPDVFHEENRTSVSRETFMIFREVSEALFTESAVPFINSPMRPFSANDPFFQNPSSLSNENTPNIFSSHEEASCGFPLVEPHEFDIVIVPLVAFDAENNRLGYGGGNYDQFLPLLHPDAYIVGVAFSEQQVDSVPTEPHDLPLPHIIST